jgi:hypothetical protein
MTVERLTLKSQLMTGLLPLAGYIICMSSTGTQNLVCLPTLAALLRYTFEAVCCQSFHF